MITTCPPADSSDSVEIADETSSKRPAPTCTLPASPDRVARALTLLGARDVDGVNWFVAGASRAIAAQQPDGSWYAGPDGAAADVLETAWRLGVLARATLPEVAIGDREEWD